MIVAVRCFADRFQHPGSRAEELKTLRRQFERISREPSSKAMRAAAREMRQQRLAIAAQLGTLQTCRNCAIRYPLPHGRWAGGYCCGTRTDAVFTDDEVCTLVLSGTKGLWLRPPRSDHAGCVFRGPSGCSLRPEDRPNICLRYLCKALVDELRQRGDIKLLDVMCLKLQQMLARFAALRQEQHKSTAAFELLGGRWAFEYHRLARVAGRHLAAGIRRWKTTR